MLNFHATRCFLLLLITRNCCHFSEKTTFYNPALRAIARQLTAGSNTHCKQVNNECHRASEYSATPVMLTIKPYVRFELIIFLQSLDCTRTCLKNRARHARTPTGLAQIHLTKSEQAALPDAVNTMADKLHNPTQFCSIYTTNRIQHSSTATHPSGTLDAQRQNWL